MYYPVSVANFKSDSLEDITLPGYEVISKFTNTNAGGVAMHIKKSQI